MQIVLDFSNNNRTPDFRKLKAHGVAGVFLRCTEGLAGPGSVDPTFHERWVAADQAGLIVGSYHFAHQDNRPTAAGAEQEAEHYISQMHKLPGHTKFAWRAGNFKPVLDFEVGTSNKRYSVWRDTFQALVYGRTRHFTTLYTYPGFNNWRMPTNSKQRGLWIADYDNNPPLTLNELEKRLHKRWPGVPGGYRSWQLWQFTSKLSISGAHEPVDASILSSRKGALAALRCSGDGR